MLYYKEFLPSEYIKRREKRYNKGLKHATWIIIIGALIFSPITISKLTKQSDKEVTSVISSKEKGIDIKELERIEKYVKKDVVGEFNNKQITITVNTNEDFKKICNEENDKIKKIEYTAEDTYKITIKRDSSK